MSRALLADARRALGIEDLVLMIHDASFPSRADEDTGRGSPYSRGARDLIEWARDRGFTGVQLGPQGETSASNKSPYDGAAFAKSLLSISLWRLADAGLLGKESLEAIVAGAPRDSTRVDYAHAFREHRRAVREACEAAKGRGDLWQRFTRWRGANASWLEREERYEAWTSTFGTDDWRRWPADLPDVRDEVFAFGQFVVHEQHAELFEYAETSGLRLFGDLQIGLSHRDCFQRDHLFLQGWKMGAPPSRTNPDGQPWGYPVFLPDAVELALAQVAKLLTEFHGLRVDHPHGHVCPWVYDATDPDPMRAVREGTRLFESPDHTVLGKYAIARADQIDRGVPRYHDRWVTHLDDEQVDVYARRIERLLAATETHGTQTRPDRAVLLEVLSTCPYPLARVLERRRLGRFRVTQKADPRNPDDVYATRQAKRADWVMLGNHDTPPIWRVVNGWPLEKKAAFCAYLEGRLGQNVAMDAPALVHAMLADLFACDADHVAIFFADLFGSMEIYNVPGVIKPDNWTLRVGNDFATPKGRGLDVPAALAIALRARGETALAARLDALSISMRATS